jgi:hypothetical protein
MNKHKLLEEIKKIFKTEKSKLVIRKKVIELMTFEDDRPKIEEAAEAATKRAADREFAYRWCVEANKAYDITNIKQIIGLQEYKLWLKENATDDYVKSNESPKTNAQLYREFCKKEYPKKFEFSKWMWAEQNKQTVKKLLGKKK